jgi:catechol 2,3-dioxygenase-like lactoylglutathione lyase family enzyme
MRIAALTIALTLFSCSSKREPRESPLVAAAKQCAKGTEMACGRPILRVDNLKASQAYYRDKLGFKVDWEYGDPPDFASVSRSETVIFLGQSRPAGHGALWVFAKDVDKLHGELKQRGARIDMPPTNMPWGSREMHVRDRDGNLLRFGGPTK